MKSEEDFASFLTALLTMNTGPKNSFLTFATMDQEFENRKKKNKKKKKQDDRKCTHDHRSLLPKMTFLNFASLQCSDTSTDDLLCDAKCFLDNGFPKQPRLFLPAHWTPDTIKKDRKKRGKKKKKTAIYRWGNQKFERRRWIGVKKDYGPGNGSERGDFLLLSAFFPVESQRGGFVSLLQLSC